jgi:ribonuclease P protein component
MYTLSKSERLCSDTLISKLFAKGNRSLARFPFRFTWLETDHPGSHPVQVLFVVSKRNFKTATSRNKIKRQLRELYRLIKPGLYTKLESRKIILSVSYTGKSAMPFQEMKTVFEKMENEFYAII